jgi:hypothetical protein
LIVWLLIPNAAFAFQNEPTGFRGISWGTPLSAVQSQMIPYADELYKRVDDKLTIGDAALMDILYRFHNGRFSEVTIFPQAGLSNENAMIAAFLVQFGSVEANHEGHYHWRGSTAEIFLDCGPQVGHKNHGCHAFIESVVERASQFNKDF